MDPIPEKPSIRTPNTAPEMGVAVERSKSLRDDKALSVSAARPSETLLEGTVAGPTLTPPSSKITGDLLPAIKRLSDALDAEPGELSPEIQYLKQQLEIGAKYAASEVILRDYVSYVGSRIDTLSAAHVLQAEPVTEKIAAAQSTTSPQETFSILEMVERALALADDDFAAAMTILNNFPKGDPEQLKRVLADAIAREMGQDRIRAELAALLFSEEEISEALGAAESRFTEVTSAILNPETPEAKSLGLWLRLAALAVGESQIRGALLGDLMDGVTAGRLPADSISQIAGPDAAAAASVAGDFLANADVGPLTVEELIFRFDSTGESFERGTSDPVSVAISLGELSELSTILASSRIEEGDLNSIRQFFSDHRSV